MNDKEIVENVPGVFAFLKKFTEENYPGKQTGSDHTDKEALVRVLGVLKFFCNECAGEEIIQ